MAAVNWVALTKVVVLAEPLNATEAAFVNPVPLTVSVKPALPATTVEGESEVSVGTAAVTAKGS